MALQAPVSIWLAISHRGPHTRLRSSHHTRDHEKENTELGGGMEKNEVAATRAKSLWLAPLGVTDHYAMLH